MAATRRAYTGAAVSTTTSSSIAASGTTSFTITAYTGWPYGTDPFYVVVEPGTASEEKILVTRTGSTDTTINVASDSVRGLDGTSAVAHNTGSTVFPVFTAVDADEANELASSWSTKGDLVSYGSSTFETLGVGADDTVLIADSGEASGLKWGSVTAAQLATGANKLGSGAAVRALGSFVGGDVLQAAELNAIGTWQTYTPVVDQNGAVAATVNFARYTRINQTVTGYARVAVTGTGSAGSTLSVTLPVAANGQFVLTGTAQLFDSSTSVNYAGGLFTSGNDVSTCWFSGDWSGANVWGLNPNLAVGNGDVINLNFTYEVA